MRYFYDSSAAYEFISGNAAVKEFFSQPNDGVVNLLVIMESYFTLLKNINEEAAELSLKMLFPLMTIPTRTIIRKAMKFRLENAKLGLSYADALGYVYAKEHQIPFVTCDSAFKGLSNVIFAR